MEVDQQPVGADKKRRKTFTLMDLMQNENVDDSLKFIDRTVLRLEKEVANALSGISDSVNKKYTEFIPDLCASNSLFDKVHKANKNLEAVDESLTKVTQSVKEDITEEDRSAIERARELKECLAKLSTLEEIEEDLALLWCTETSEAPLRFANLVTAAEKKLCLLAEKKADIDETFAEKIFPPLRQEVLMLRENICHSLNQYWDQIFTFQEQDGNFIMKIHLEAKKLLVTIEERFEAMDVLQILDGKLAKLSNSLLNNFCFIIMHHANVDFTYNEGVALVNQVSQYRISKAVQGNIKQQSCDLENIFNLLRMFFGCIFKDLGNLKVKDVKLIKLLYDKMSSKLMDFLLRDCIASSIPMGPGDEEKFKQMQAFIKDFLNFLATMGYIEDAERSLTDFMGALDSVFNSRHCTGIIAEARSLVCSLYVELETVGYTLADERETVEEFRVESALLKSETLKNRENFPRLLRFAKCQVSKSTLDLIELVKSTILKAADAKCKDVAERLMQTARNAIQLFICIAPRHHQTQILSVPQMAAVFYNNCYYICHCLMTMPIDIPQEARELLHGKGLPISFVDFFPSLRQLAADSLEKHLAQCRRQIASLLSNERVFVDLDNSHNLISCGETLNGCILYLTQIANVWRSVFSNTVFAKALGNLVAFLFNSLIRIVFATEDIRAYDAEVSANELSRTVSAMEKLFMFDDTKQSSIHRFAEKEYFRIKEVIFCLNGSLQDVFDRWCSGKGPLAQWLQSKELRQLVKALFQSSEKREMVLQKIG